MGTLEFIVELTKALAWPIAVVLVGVLFRVPLTRVIESLRRLKFKEVEAEFDEGLKEVRNALPHASAAPVPSGPGPKARAALPSSEETEDLLRNAPAGAVIASWSDVERALLEAVRRVVGSEKSVGSVLAMAKQLRERGALNDATLSSVRALQSLRNLVVHGGPAARERLSADKAREFVAMAQAVQTAIELDIERFSEHRAAPT